MYRLQMTQLTGVQRLLAVLVAGAALFVAIIALPVLLAIGAIALLALMITGRLAISRMKRRYEQQEHTAQWETSQDYVRTGFMDKDSFKPKPHVGQTYDNGQY
ncbi:hypothetical protein L2725_15955 [Shewanella corallii]|uniref:Uncharacterized protein n=1 Tax=Shewanella corallii TaxID=560080 RepID=A0ABT0NA56_9GAMM|nr:hypothetical protein [Shewanella corallii]MCL2915255.1 hypothetical protein [Shewanella corallii]